MRSICGEVKAKTNVVLPLTDLIRIVIKVNLFVSGENRATFHQSANLCVSAGQ